MNKVTKKRREKHMWTVDEIKTLTRLWNELDVDQVAQKLKMEKGQVVYMAGQIGKMYPKLVPRKHHTGYLRALIHTALD